MKPAVFRSKSSVLLVRKFHTLESCTHKEVDTRIMAHTSDDVVHSHRKFPLLTVDTDILILVISATTRLVIDELWVAFSLGQHFRYLAAHQIAS